jgi:hypothetical protein
MCQQKLKQINPLRLPWRRGEKTESLNFIQCTKNVLEIILLLSNSLTFLNRIKFFFSDVLSLFLFFKNLEQVDGTD